MRRAVCALLGMNLLAACNGAQSSADNATGGFAGAFDQAFKAEYRTKFVANCRSSADRAMPEQARAAGMPIVVRMCDCAVDKVMAGASTRELATPSPEKLQAAAKACAAEAATRAAR